MPSLPLFSQALLSAETRAPTERKVTSTRLFAEEAPTQTMPPPTMKGLDTVIALPVSGGRGDVLDDCARELRQMMARVRTPHAFRVAQRPLPLASVSIRSRQI
jgi:hypothetical protein